MVTLKPLSTSALSCSNGKVKVHVFSKGALGKFGEADLTLLTRPLEKPSKNVISWPGEYDLKEVSIRAIGQEEGKYVSYVLSMDGVRVGVLSSPLHDWSEEELRAFGDVDILVIPAEDSERVTTVIEEIDSPVVVPLQTGDEKTFQNVLKAIGGEDAKVEKEIKIRPGTIKKEERAVYVLKS
jgi:hypothetical protein